jgi:SAM-dependent methyltransferase
MSNFYRAFEERYRGDRAVIAARLTAYDPFTVPLAAARPGGIALDLGCGRGEWLELTAHHGFAAFGVDLDENMLAACRERGLHVDTADALATLRARDDASVALISAFHLVEHLPFELVQELVAQARRVLVPGGLLIMETPNPENLVVGTNNFYLDPSHIKPVPALLLGFTTDHAGFARHTVVRLHGAPIADAGHPIGLAGVLQGVSYDYAIVAQKQADAGMLAAFDDAFATPYGVSLDQIATRFDQGWMGALADLDACAAQSAGLDAQARAQGTALAELDQGLRHASGEFDKRLVRLEGEDAAVRIDRLEQYGLPERMLALEQSGLAARLDALEQSGLAARIDALEQSRLAARIEALEQSGLAMRIEALEQSGLADRLRLVDDSVQALQANLHGRIDGIERQVTHFERNLGPLMERLNLSQLQRDDAVARTTEFQRHLDYVNWRLSVTEEELRQARAQVVETSARLDAVHAEKVMLVYSYSWRVTAPLRVATRIVRRVRAAARAGRLLSAVKRRLLGTPPPSPPAPPDQAGTAGADGALLLPPEFANMPESSRKVLLDLVRAGSPSTPHQP